MSLDVVYQQLLDAALLDETELNQKRSEWEETGAADSSESEAAHAFLDFLVSQHHITKLQAVSLEQGISGPYQIGPYQLEDVLFAGRLGYIFKAIHQDFNQPVSLKWFSGHLKDDPDCAQKLSTEMRVAVQVNHPNVVNTYFVGSAGNAHFLAMEPLEGESLESLLEQQGKLTSIQACQIACDIARGIGHLHSLDIIHRVIHPRNIWITPEGHAKIHEFYEAYDVVSEWQDETVADNTSLQNDLNYLAPEQGMNINLADSRSDVYSLGCVFFHSLTGEVPFPERDPIRKMLQHALKDARRVTEVNSDLTTEVADVVATMLEKRPEDRFSNAEDALWALERLLGTEEQREAVAQEINEDFLKWAKQESETQSGHAVLAEPELLQFLDTMGKKSSE